MRLFRKTETDERLRELADFIKRSELVDLVRNGRKCMTKGGGWKLEPVDDWFEYVGLKKHGRGKT